MDDRPVLVDVCWRGCVDIADDCIFSFLSLGSSSSAWSDNSSAAACQDHGVGALANMLGLTANLCPTLLATIVAVQ
jgi:hypothetical protein